MGQEHNDLKKEGALIRGEALIRDYTVLVISPFKYSTFPLKPFKFGHCFKEILI